MGVTGLLGMAFKNLCLLGSAAKRDKEACGHWYRTPGRQEEKVVRDTIAPEPLICLKEPKPGITLVLTEGFNGVPTVMIARTPDTKSTEPSPAATSESAPQPHT